MAPWLALALALLVPLSGARAAEKPEAPAFAVTVEDVSGTETLVRNFRLYTKGGEDRVFVGRRGAGQVVIPFRLVRTLEVRPERKKGAEVLVIVTDWKGKRQDLYISGYYVGELPVGQFFIEIPQVRKITFHPPKSPQAAKN